MFLGYTAHSIWDSSHKQIGRIQTKKKKKEGAKKHFKFQAENYEISVCLSGFMYVSVCVFWVCFFFNNIAEVVNEFYLNSGSHELKIFNIKYLTLMFVC